MPDSEYDHWVAATTDPDALDDDDIDELEEDDESIDLFDDGAEPAEEVESLDLLDDEEE